jgi:hypothetical protein
MDAMKKVVENVTFQTIPIQQYRMVGRIIQTYFRYWVKVWNDMNEPSNGGSQQTFPMDRHDYDVILVVIESIHNIWYANGQSNIPW